MDLFSNIPDVVLDLIFAQLSEYDLHETYRVSRCWFWASIRRIKEVRITREYNPLKVWADFYNNHHRTPNEDVMDWRHLFNNLVLKKLVINNNDEETINYLLDNGCSTIKLTIFACYKGRSRLTLASLKRFTRLQFFEYHLASGTFTSERSMDPFAVECLKDFDFGEYDYGDDECDEDDYYKFGCEIQSIELSSDGWHNSGEDSVLKSITSLSVSYTNIEFLRKLIGLCSNLQEIYCSNVKMTQDWHQVFPANIKRIVMQSMNIEWDVDEYGAIGRQLLPFLCQSWESVELFELKGEINSYYDIDYVAYPSEREDLLKCSECDVGSTDLASPIFQCRRIELTSDGWLCRTGPYIPKVATIKFEIEEFSQIDWYGVSLCRLFFEPGQVEHLSIHYQIMKGLGHEHFKDDDFEDFTGLTSLSLSCVTAGTIKTFLDQCLWIEKLALISLAPMTLDKLPEEAIYENVSELRLEYCDDEQIDTVFKVFPCITLFILVFRYGHPDDERSVERLRQKLATSDKQYGFVYQYRSAVWYMHYDELEPVLNQTQLLLAQNNECTCYMKGFKLSPRFPGQKVIYMD